MDVSPSSANAALHVSLQNGRNRWSRPSMKKRNRGIGSLDSPSDDTSIDPVAAGACCLAFNCLNARFVQSVNSTEYSLQASCHSSPYEYSISSPALISRVAMYCKSSCAAPFRLRSNKDVCIFLFIVSSFVPSLFHQYQSTSTFAVCVGLWLIMAAKAIGKRVIFECADAMQ